MSDRSPTLLDAAPALDAPEPPARFPRLRAAMVAPLRWLALLVLPDRAVPRAVRDGRYGGPMLVATVAAALAALTLAGRVDLREQVLAPQGPPDAPAATGKPDAGMSDRELAEALEKARTVEQVKGGLAAAATPLAILGFALLLAGASRFVGGKPTMKRAVALAAAAWMPDAVRAGLTALAASRRAIIAPMQIPSLVTAPFAFKSHLLAIVFAHVDPFTLWSWALVAVGMPALAGVSRRKSVATTIVLFALVHAVVFIAAASKPPGAHP